MDGKGNDNDMDYLKRKKEHVHLALTAAYSSGFFDHQLRGRVGVEWRGKTEEEVDKIIDQVYKRGLKDGRNEK